MRVLLTGSTGFIGNALKKSLALKDFRLVTPLRTSSDADIIEKSDDDCPLIDDINGLTKWDQSLRHVDIVVHCAACPSSKSKNNILLLAALREVNVAGTLHLAKQAAARKVKRFIFLSSLKVNGETTIPGQFVTEADPIAFQDPYSQSKAEAEEGLMEIADKTAMEIVIIRPPLVYGPNAKGNFAKLVTMVGSGMPLPFGMIKNERSFIAIDNLVDLILTCLDHPLAANQVFLASDGRDLSTPELIRGIAAAMDKPPNLWAFPPSFLHLGAAIVNRKDLAERLIGSLRVDISKAKTRLGWSPPITVEEGLRRCFIAKK